jgi:hypothetical protein
MTKHNVLKSTNVNRGPEKSDFPCKAARNARAPKKRRTRDRLGQIKKFLSTAHCSACCPLSSNWGADRRNKPWPRRAKPDGSSFTAWLLLTSNTKGRTTIVYSAPVGHTQTYPPHPGFPQKRRNGQLGWHSAV